MATLTKYNLQGEKTGQVNVDDTFVSYEANGQMVKDYIVALRENARQWSASTKTRAEVEHTTKKPHPQKGTGNARQGTLVAPQHRGGGRAHGPRPKFDQHVRINKKERRAAIRSLLAEKIRNGRLIVVETMQLDAPKTQTVFRFLNACGRLRSVLFLGDHENQFDEGRSHFCKSARNIEKVSFLPATQLSGYDILVAHDLVVTEVGLQEMIEWLR